MEKANKFDSKEQKVYDQGRAVLDQNWKAGFTAPSLTLYPHQWSWDAAFVAIGNAHVNQDRAQDELLSLFGGQWENGMLPHIIYRTQDGYFQPPKFWQTELSPRAPEIKTSGITQPPIHAIAAWHIYEVAEDQKKAEAFLQRIFPQLLHSHQYLLTKRDPEETGLVTIFNPWESGFDNSVRWDQSLSAIEVAGVPEYRRTDLDKVGSEERPTNDFYDRYVYLIEILKQNKYEEERVYSQIPFKVKDVVLSSILYQANRRLKRIAELIGGDTKTIGLWLERTKKHYFQYFCNQKEQQYLVYDYDLITQSRIEKRTTASLMAICTDLLSQEMAQNVFSWMEHAHVCSEACDHRHSVASSVPFDSEEFNPLNYWRGPVWININWMLFNGLKEYGFLEEAEALKKAIIDLVAEHGFYEYYNPLSGQGLGINDFSWSAALSIDLLHH